MQILCAVRQTIGISYDCSRAGPGECASTQFSAPSLLVDGHRLGTNKSTRPYLHVAIGITTYDLNPSGRQFAIGLADSRERVAPIVACLEGKRNCDDTHCHRNLTPYGRSQAGLHRTARSRPRRGATAPCIRRLWTTSSSRRCSRAIGPTMTSRRRRPAARRFETMFQL